MKLSELFEAEERSVLSVLGGYPSFTKTFICNNKGLTSLKGPSFIGGDFFCYNNKLTSLHNIHKIIKHIGGRAFFNNCPITECILGLLLIDELEFVGFSHGANEELQTIMNKHLKGDRDLFACQEELIENGFEDLAQL